jgi:hypothetical protein
VPTRFGIGDGGVIIETVGVVHPELDDVPRIGYRKFDEIALCQSSKKPFCGYPFF